MSVCLSVFLARKYHMSLTACVHVSVSTDSLRRSQTNTYSLLPTSKTDAVMVERTSNVIRQVSGSKRGKEWVQVQWK